ELPMPEPIYNGGERLPARYANFYIANDQVLLPVFDCPADDVARDVLAAGFPDRRIVPIDCRALVAGLGALHCLTQQVPAVWTSGDLGLGRARRPVSRVEGRLGPSHHR